MVQRRAEIKWMPMGLREKWLNYMNETRAEGWRMDVKSAEDTENRNLRTQVDKGKMVKMCQESVLGV